MNPDHDYSLTPTRIALALSFIVGCAVLCALPVVLITVYITRLFCK